MVLRKMTFKRKHIIPLHHQITLLNRLKSLLQNGYSLSRALSLIKFDPVLGTYAKQIEAQLKNGKPIDIIFQEMGFSNLVVSFLYFSNSTGKLDESFAHGYLLLQQQKLFSEKLKKVMQYPVLLFLFLLVLFICLKLFLLPSLSTLYMNFQKGNSDSLFLLRAIDGISNSFILVVVLGIIGLIIWKSIKEKVPFHFKLKIYHNIPLLKSYKKMETSYLFSYHFSTLLLSGLPIKNALKIMANQDHTPLLKYYAKALITSIHNGQQLPETIRSFPLMEDELGLIVQRSLNDGTLEKDLYNYSNMLIDSMIEKMNKMLAFVQPACYIFFGVIIVGVYLSILLPMFQLIQQI